MATIEPYETARGRRYRVLYRTPEQKQTSKRGFRTKKDAELFRASVEVKKATGEFIDASAGRTTVGERSGSWLAGKEAAQKPSAYRALEITWRLHVEPRWGNVALSAVEQSAVQAWVTELSRKRSATVTLRA